MSVWSQRTLLSYKRKEVLNHFLPGWRRLCAQRRSSHGVPFARISHPELVPEWAAAREGFEERYGAERNHFLLLDIYREAIEARAARSNQVDQVKS